MANKRDAAPTDAWKTQAVLGKGLVDRLNEPVLIIGNNRWSRVEMIEQLHCGNFAAAKRISAAIKKHHPKIRDVKQFVKEVHMRDLLRIVGTGVVQAYVIMCAVEFHGMDPLAWVNSDEDTKEIVTIDTIQKRARLHE